MLAIYQIVDLMAATVVVKKSKLIIVLIVNALSLRVSAKTSGQKIAALRVN